VSHLPGTEWAIAFYIAVFFAWFVLVNRGQKLQDKIYGIPSLATRGHLAMTLCSLILFIVSLSYVTGSGFNPFIYFRF
jgi:uncharacterized membrane protein